MIIKEYDDKGTKIKIFNDKIISNKSQKDLQQELLKLLIIEKKKRGKDF